MTKYFCRKCNTQMETTEQLVGTFKHLIRCPKCGTEIIVDHKEDLG